ncbi:MLP-like protein 28 [Humulus lupulus]|uniref:MLP-like protein 28 n=1 Tax=Humulus lupulus TaxID=3486 RepID=UPI002B403768|nr:MLP-like protein 28 [Humulus lupulus]
MVSITKMEVELDIKSSAERFYQTCYSKHYLVNRISPDVAKDVQLLKGDWESVGSIRLCTYVLPGNSFRQNDTLMVEATDEDEKSITYKVLDGEVLKYYKSFKFSVQVTGKCWPAGGAGGSLVKTTIECEKLKDDVPDPIKYAEFFEIVLKDIDTYLINNA